MTVDCKLFSFKTEVNLILCQGFKQKNHILLMLDQNLLGAMGRCVRNVKMVLNNSLSATELV